MTDELMKEMGAEDWPKGLYMIFATKDHDAVYGKVIGLTRTAALYHPWDIQFGGVDEDAAHLAVLADFDEFVAFEDIWDMDDYFQERKFNLMRGEIKMGEIK